MVVVVVVVVLEFILQSRDVSRVLYDVMSIFHELNQSRTVYICVENLLLTEESANAEVKIIDFGLSKVMETNTASSYLGTKVCLSVGCFFF